jgi:hypothetical protein
MWTYRHNPPSPYILISYILNKEDLKTDFHVADAQPTACIIYVKLFWSIHKNKWHWKLIYIIILISVIFHELTMENLNKTLASI